MIPKVSTLPTLITTSSYNLYPRTASVDSPTLIRDSPTLIRETTAELNKALRMRTRRTPYSVLGKRVLIGWLLLLTAINIRSCLSVSTSLGELYYRGVSASRNILQASSASSLVGLFGSAI